VEGNSEKTEIKVMTGKPETIMLALDVLHPSKTQPRRHFNADRHVELTESMKQHGFTLSTLLVRPVQSNGKTDYEIVVGERRVRAAKAAGIRQAPCWVREYSDSEVVAIQLIENLQREDLTAIEEAEGYRKALDLRNLKGETIFTVQSLAKQIGKSDRYIELRLTLCKLPDEARREVEAGRLPPKTAMLIARIPDESLRLKATAVILHPKDEIGPLSLRRAEIKIHEHFIRDLRQAKFEQEDAELLPVFLNEQKERAGGGACIDCPFKAGNAKAGESQSDINRSNTCMNPSCYEQKQSYVWIKWQNENTNYAENRHATSQEQSEKLYPRGNQLAQHFCLVDLADCPDSNDLKPGVTTRLSWGQLTKKAKLKVIVTQDRLGATHELVDRQQAIEAAMLNGHDDIFKSTKHERPPDAEQRKQEEKKKQKQSESSKGVLVACIELVRKNVSSKTIAALLRLQLDREIEFSKAHPDFCKRNGLPIGGTVAKQLGRRPLKDLVALLVEFVVAEGGFSYDELLDSNRAWLEVFGVNYDKVAKRLAKKPKRD
jgi:ParB/RepB/Spo0J family partition protein